MENNRYDEARTHAIRYLTEAIKAHEKGDFLSVGDGFDEYDRMLPRDGKELNKLLIITLEFWASWSDTAEHSWKFYPPFKEGDWPQLAKILLEDLKVNREVTNKTLLEHFVPKPPQPRRSFFECLRNFFFR